jgi:hypothetical protein
MAEYNSKSIEIEEPGILEKKLDSLASKEPDSEDEFPLTLQDEVLMMGNGPLPYTDLYKLIR